ncbi:hypothetical protein HAX54_050253, partial [Datura stramonium]|nr:hypothetical protein [Datura stramonium]
MAVIFVPFTNCQTRYCFSVIESTPEICPVRSAPRRNDAPFYVSWSFPLLGFIKINTDGEFHAEFRTDLSDALMMLSVRDNVDRYPDHVVIEECRSLMAELKISIMHTLRQGNICAYHLAKMGRMQQEDLIILHPPPHSMYQLLLADMAHVAYP